MKGGYLLGMHNDWTSPIMTLIHHLTQVDQTRRGCWNAAVGPREMLKMNDFFLFL